MANVGSNTNSYVIEVDFSDQAEANRAYDAIEKLLAEMGEIGTLCLLRRTHNRATENERAGR